MARTFSQMEEEEISAAEGIPAADALALLEGDSKALLVDVRDTAEMESTGIYLNAIAAPGRAIAWMADLESEYHSPELQNRTKKNLYNMRRGSKLSRRGRGEPANFNGI